MDPPPWSMNAADPPDALTMDRDPARAHAVAPPRGLPVESVALLAAFVLTVFDATATHTWLASGVATEGNPLIRSLMELIGNGPALAVRVAVGGALLLALRALAERTHHARTALLASVAVLAAVAVWHLQGFVLLVTV
jgi:hypothetical protein